MAATSAQTILKESEDKMKKAADIVSHEFATLRTGRASASLVEGIRVDYYGTPTPLKQLAAISVPEPRLIAVQPWDPSTIPLVEQAILKSELGLNPSNDGKVVRIGIPSLTDERRRELDKLIKKMAEEGRIAIRAVRRDANEHLKKLQNDKVITEDDAHHNQNETQKLTDKYIASIDSLLKSKEQEITQS